MGELAADFAPVSTSDTTPAHEWTGDTAKKNTEEHFINKTCVGGDLKTGHTYKSMEKVCKESPQGELGASQSFSPEEKMTRRKIEWAEENHLQHNIRGKPNEEEVILNNKRANTNKFYHNI